jgi:hypothetical protein
MWDHSDCLVYNIRRAFANLLMICATAVTAALWQVG